MIRVLAGRDRDVGSATVLVLGLAAAVWVAGLAVLLLAQVANARARAATAADLAALAGAVHVVTGDSCRAAARVAAAQSADVAPAGSTAGRCRSRLRCRFVAPCGGSHRRGPGPAPVLQHSPPGEVPAGRPPSRTSSRRRPRACRGARCRCRTSATGRTKGSRRRRGSPRRRTRRPQPGGRGAVPALGEAGAARVPVVHEDRGLPGVGVQRCREPADVPAVARREQRQQPDGGVLGGMRRPGDVPAATPGRGEGLLGQRPPDRTGAQGPRRQVERVLAQHLAAAQALAHVGRRLGGDVDRRRSAAPPRPSRTARARPAPRRR